MKFHTFRTLYDQLGRLDSSLSVPEFYARFMQWSDREAIRKDFGGDVDMSMRMKRAITGMEMAWMKEMRPYYKVWPSVIPCLLAMKLDIKPSDLRIAPRVIAIRFSGDHPVTSILVCASKQRADDEYATVLCVADQRGEQEVAEYPLVASLEADNCTFEEMTLDGRKHIMRLIPGEELWEIDATYRSLRIALSILLLADDPSIIEPDVLSKDELAYERTKDQKYVDKAHRRGKVGWHIGKTFESIPHFRRPHPALFHTGKGRTIPRIVFRSGCVVHREKMVKVPTGYITPEGVEVEPE